MKVLICNIIGIGNKASQQQLWYFNNVVKLDVFVVLEPMVSLDEYVFKKKFKMDQVVANVSNKIWLFSSASYHVEILLDHEQLLHCKVTSTLLPKPVLLTIVYAKCTRRERIDLWNSIRHMSVDDMPWLIRGDFNIIMNESERVGRAAPDTNAMRDFNNCILDMGLMDLGYSGLSFTWQWREVKQRLDRLLANSEWMDTFASNTVQHAIRRCSNHRIDP